VTELASGTAEHIDRIVEAAYGALYDPPRWREVVGGYAEVMSADGAALYQPTACGGSGAIYLTHNMDLDRIRPALERNVLSSPVMARAAALGATPGVFLHQDALGYEDLHASAFYRELMRPLDVEHGLSSMVEAGQDPAEAVALTVTRGRGRQPFGPEEAQVARDLFPHLRRVIGLRLEMGLGQAVDPATYGALDGFDVACCLLGDHGRLLFANTAAREMLAHPRATLVIAGSRLAARQSRLDGALQAAIAGACNTASPWSARAQAEVRLGGPGADPIVAVATPLGHDNMFLDAGPVRAALYLIGAGHSIRPEAMGRLSRIYGLTQAESDIVGQLLNGASVAEIAQARSSSINTVRTQVRVILEKTGSDRQADLFRLGRFLMIQG
jgi:DNA-binding CsgD family transcriptional regulator